MFLLRTLGSVQLLRATADGEEPLNTHAKRLALLLFLARGGRGPLLRRDVLLGLLWPDSDQTHGRGALRQALSGLRRQLGSGAILNQGEEEVGLAPELLTCDATEFETAGEEGRHADACRMYQGDFAAGFHVTGLGPDFDQWVETERARLRHLALRSAGAAAEQAEREGRPAEAVTLMRRAIELAPDDEASVVHLIGVLDRMGDRSAALAAYQVFERRLAAEYSATPSPETRALIAAVRNRSTPRQVPPVSDESSSRGFADASPADVPPNSFNPGPAASSSTRRTLITAGVIAALITGAVLTGLARVKPPPTSPTWLIEVHPFKVTGADSTIRWLGDGMVDLLSIRLSGVEGLEVVEPGRGVSVGRTVQGQVTVAGSKVVLTSWIREEPGGRVLAQAGVSGPSDSLQGLIDRLAIQLIGQSAGLEANRLASSTSTSIPAIRAFLAGRAAFRTGRMAEALQHFLRAVQADSDFAVAAFDLYRAAQWANGGEVARIGERRAVALHDRLSPADRALLNAMQSPNSDQMFANWNLVTTAYPDRPEGWYGLGHAYFHWGALSGIEGSLTRAEGAFRRGWQLDSAAQAISGARLVAEPMLHMVGLAHIRNDTLEVRRLVAQVMAADSTTDLAQTLRWHLAVMDGDSARQAFWNRIGTVSQRTTMWIRLFIVWSGVGSEDLYRATAEDDQRLKMQDPGWSSYAARLDALNSGRPSRVPARTGGVGNPQRPALGSRLRDAMWWEGDSSAAVEAARLLIRYVHQPASDPGEIRIQYQEICALAEWQMAAGDLQGAQAASRRLRAARLPNLQGTDSVGFRQFTSLCASLIDATMASVGEPPVVARVAIGRADSMARSSILQVCCGEAVGDANLQLARLWERAGDLPSALRALRRGAAGYEMAPLYLSTFLREEGRVSVLMGDTTSAIRAYRHYLMLRPDPEPSIRPAVERVRQQLAALLGR